MNPSNRLHWFTFLLLIPVWLHAQVTDRKVDVVYKLSEATGEYLFKASNPNLCEYTVQVDVVDVVGMRSSVRLPYVGSVKPGETTLFSLKPTKMGEAASFRYLYTATRGRLFQTEPPAYVYALPVAPGKPTLVQETQAMGKVLGVKSDRLTNYTSLVFQVKNGDTVFAARRGLVVNRLDGWATTARDDVRESNLVEISHADGTFAQYARLKAGSLFVKLGETVEVGQPLGLAGELPNGVHTIHFSVRYLPPVEVQPSKEYKYIHVRPKFSALTIEAGDYLTSGRTYEATRPVELITQEMSKREIKRYLKQ